METPPPFENDRYASPPSEPKPKPKTQPRKWYRFTLWKMVVAFVLLGVVFAYLRYTHWGYVLSENITRVGRSFGLVEQRDPNKIYVSAVRPLGNKDWEWSVQIPRSEIYMICYWVGDIPVSGRIEEIERRYAEVKLSWNYLVNVYAKETWKDGIAITVHDHNGVLPQYNRSGWHTSPDLSWMSKSVKRTAIELSDGEQVFEPGEKIVLLHQWPSDSNPLDKPGALHQEGIMIWLEPAPYGGPWDKHRLPPAVGNAPSQNW